MIRRLLFVFSVLGIALVTFGQGKKKEKGLITTQAGAKVNYKETGAALPPLNIYTREGKHLTEKDLANDATLIIMLFNPTCEHCEDQTVQFRENISLFTKTKIVLVAAPNMGPYLSYFTNNTKIGDVSALQVGIDSCGYIDKTFTYESLPQINIYNKERKLVKVYNGPVAIDELKQYIE